MSYSVRDLVAAAKTVIREVEPSELLELQKFGCPIVDVREPEEFADGHLPGAVNIPRGLLEFEVDGHPAVNYQTAEALSHRQRPVVLYCLSGGRSALAAEALLGLGFGDPVSLADGTLGWADAGRPVVSPGTDALHDRAARPAAAIVTNCG
jgi:rhodanese-related sulfurtransferase